MTISVLVTDGDLNPVGQPVDGWMSLTALRNFNAAGSGALIVKASADVLAQVYGTARARLVVIRNRAVYMCGPIEQPNLDRVESGGTSGGGDSDQANPGLVTINFTDDFASIASQLTYAEPTLVSTAQGTASYTATAVNSESLIHTLVNDNVGPGALTARQIPRLTLAATGGLGSNINFTTRFEALGDALRRAALAGGNLGFSTTQDTNRNIVFGTYQPSDKSDLIRFSWPLGNLVELHYSPSPPTCNAAIVGGSGVIRERLDTASIAQFGRIEQYIDRGSEPDTTVLDQAGDQALADGSASAQVSFVAMDVPYLRFGTDYGLGDTVTVEVAPGVEINSSVQAVTLTASPNGGERITPLIGADSAITDSKTLAALRALAQRLGYQERN